MSIAKSASDPQGARPPSGRRSEPGAAPPGHGAGRNLKILLGVIVVAALAFATHRLGGERLVGDLLQWISGLGAIAPLVFVVVYILACVLFVPGLILTVGAGFLFGVIWGTVYVSVASTAGATCAFVIGRYFAREWVAAKIAGNAKFAAIDGAIAREGWKIVVLTRLSPLFPFNLLNYALGLTRVSPKEYVLASWAGMLPATIVYVYLGSLAGDLTRVAAHRMTHTPAEWALYATGFIATLGIVFYATRIASRALNERT